MDSIRLRKFTCHRQRPWAWPGRHIADLFISKRPYAKSMACDIRKIVARRTSRRGIRATQQLLRHRLQVINRTTPWVIIGGQPLWERKANPTLDLPIYDVGWIGERSALRNQSSSNNLRSGFLKDKKGEWQNVARQGPPPRAGWRWRGDNRSNDHWRPTSMQSMGYQRTSKKREP